MFFSRKNKAGFTLIELLVVITIIGILSTLAVISFNNARNKSRDTKKVNDVSSLRTALELYKTDQGYYPVSITPGMPLAAGNKIYLPSVPDTSIGSGDDCTDEQNQFAYYPSSNRKTYQLSFCLGGDTGSLKAGIKCAISDDVLDSTCVKTIDYTWTQLGTDASNGLSAYSVVGTVMNNIPYVVYRDTGDPLGLLRGRVKKYEAGSWQEVGDYVSTDRISSMSFDSYNNNLYLAYSQGAPHVKKFENNAWSEVGSFSETYADQMSLANISDGFYASFSNGSSLVVTKLVGNTWVTLPNSSFGWSADSKLRAYNNVLYLGYINDSGVLSIKKFVDSTWQQVGVDVATNANKFDFSVSSSGVYVAYGDGGGNLVVKKNNGGNDWQQVGTTLNYSNFSETWGMLSTPNDYFRIAHTYLGDILIKEMDGNSWKNIGTIAASTYDFVLTSGDGEIPYIFYEDGTDNFKAKVRKAY